MNSMGHILSPAVSSHRSPQVRTLHGKLKNSAPPIVHDVLRSPGRALDSSPRRFLESRLHFDFSRVRVHDDGKAADSARAIGSLAYTAGQHIVFAKGQYNPRTHSGMGLLAHEMTHVAQQSGAVSPGSEPLPVGEPGNAAEQNADETVRSMASGGDRPRIQGHPIQVMRATRTFALTFDDGPHAAELGKGINLTEKVLDTLKAKSVKAGFFIQTGVSYRGANAVGRTLVARMQAEGHVVGVHTGGTTDHELHTAAEADGRLEGELESGKKYIKKQTGSAPKYVRPPTGKFDEAVTATYKKVGLMNLLWDVDGDTGKSLPLATLKTRIESGINTLNTAEWKGSTAAAPKLVFLYHDIQKNTADNVGAIIDHIKDTTNSVTSGADSAGFGAP